MVGDDGDRAVGSAEEAPDHPWEQREPGAIRGYDKLSVDEPGRVVVPRH